MNYNEYFGKNPNAGWGTSGARDTNNEDWSKYFQPGTQQVPIKKVYSDSPVVVDNQNGQVRTYMDVDPVVVQRPTHEQMLMQQQQMAASRRLAEEQKAYYDKMWANKVNQMEDDGLGSDVPATPKTVKKLSFVNKPKVDVVEEQKSVTVDVMSKPVGDPGHPMPTPEEMEQAKAALNAAAKKYAEEQKEIHHIESVEEDILDNEPEDVVETNEIHNEIGVIENVIDDEPIEPILAGDAEVEAIVEEETNDDFDNVLGGLDVDDVAVTPDNDNNLDELTDDNDSEEQSAPNDDMPDDMPSDIEDMNIDLEYEEERNARIAEQERLAQEAEKVEKKTVAKRSRKKANDENPKRKKPVVTTKKKKSTK